jgi:hypothetical protein
MTAIAMNAVRTRTGRRSGSAVIARRNNAKAPPFELLYYLFPKGGVARSEERVFAGVPAQEMGGVGVLRVGFAGVPDFVEQQRAGRVNGPVQIIAEAAVFFSSGAHKRAKFGFEDGFLAFARTQQND